MDDPEVWKKYIVNTLDRGSSEKQQQQVINAGYDITTEAAVAKLYYLFSRDPTREGIMQRMERSLRGEISV